MASRTVDGGTPFRFTLCRIDRLFYRVVVTRKDHQSPRTWTSQTLMHLENRKSNGKACIGSITRVVMY